MITNFKIFETDYSKYPKIEQKILNCGFYITSQLPSEDFFDWEWDEYDFFLNKNNNSVTYFFYYNLDVDSDIVDKIYEFFDEYELKYEFEYGLHSLAGKIEKQEKYEVKVPIKLIKEFSKIYTNAKKYNI